MKKLISGFSRFRTEVFSERRERFAKLGAGQSPQALFITCSDSRVDPNLVTQTEPGDLFILRNAGNIVPAWGTGGAGEAATIEFAVLGLGIEHIVVCGHSHCGAMKAVLAPPNADEMPALRDWIRHADATRRLVAECYADRSPEEKLNVAIQENVLAQVKHLETHPAVAARVAAGRLQLHAWVYEITKAQLFAFDAEHGQFRALSDVTIREPEPRLVTGGLLAAGTG